MINLTNAKEINLYDLKLYNAELRIYETIEKAWFSGEQYLFFIHGYNSGLAIRDFIRDKWRLKKKLKRDFPEIPEIDVREKDYWSAYVSLPGS